MTDLFGDTELWFVDTPERLAEMVEALNAATVIGVDTESDSFHHYREKVCLIQFSDLERDYILDPLAVSDISALAPMFADPSKVKIFHGADYDMVCLNRDFGFTFRNVFDTMIASQMAYMPKIGLADLIDRYFGITIDKQYQRHDWAKRPLLDEHIQYARGDTHYLLAIREFLIRELRAIGRMGHVEEECERIEAREFVPRVEDPNRWLKTKRSSHLSDGEKRILKHLWQFRDRMAQRQDRPSFKIIPDPVLVKAAEIAPKTIDALESAFPQKRAMRNRYGEGMVAAVLAGLDDDEPIPSSKRASKESKPSSSHPRRLVGKQAERAFEELKRWRNNLLQQQAGRAPVTIASNSTLKAIAAARPFDLEELGAIPDVRRWQVADYGEAILEALETAAPAAKVGTAAEESGESTAKPKRRRRRKRTTEAPKE